MTEFFDKKEDVMDIQLTQYGKHLLSMGKFKPVYYAFYDQDVVYDGRYGPGRETQNEAQHRIKNLTSHTKAQYVFRGIETSVNELNKKTCMIKLMGFACLLGLVILILLNLPPGM